MTIAEQLRAEGYENGMRQGALQGERELLIRLLKRRFGSISDYYLAKINQANGDSLLQWGEKILEAKTIEDVVNTRH